MFFFFKQRPASEFGWVAGGSEVGLSVLAVFRFAGGPVWLLSGAGGGGPEGWRARLEAVLCRRDSGALIRGPVLPELRKYCGSENVLGTGAVLGRGAAGGSQQAWSPLWTPKWRV